MLEKLKSHKKLLVMSMVLCLVVSSFCFASGDTYDNLDFSPITSAVTGQISPTTIIVIVAGVVTAGIGFVMAWFGIRTVLKYLRKAIFKGRI